MSDEYGFTYYYMPPITIPAPGQVAHIALDDEFTIHANPSFQVPLPGCEEPTTERNIPVAQPVDADCYYCGDRPATQLEDQPPKCNACRRKWQR